MPKVVVQKWEESERGCTRPDGYSLHLSEGDRERYVKDYWNGMPDEVPDEYSRTCGQPYEAEVDTEVYEKVLTAKVEGTPGIRYFTNNYPGDGGPDGWRNVKR